MRPASSLTKPATVAAVLDGTDDQTATKRHHRILIEQTAGRAKVVEYLRGAIVVHHADAEKRSRIAKINEALQRQGYAARSVYPTHLNTRKGNLAEIVLGPLLVRPLIPLYAMAPRLATRLARNRRGMEFAERFAKARGRL